MYSQSPTLLHNMKSYLPVALPLKVAKADVLVYEDTKREGEREGETQRENEREWGERKHVSMTQIKFKKI